MRAVRSITSSTSSSSAAARVAFTLEEIPPPDAAMSLYDSP
jgi:hypothetical protein